MLNVLPFYFLLSLELEQNIYFSSTLQRYFPQPGCRHVWATNVKG